MTLTQAQKDLGDKVVALIEKLGNLGETKPETAYIDIEAGQAYDSEDPEHGWNQRAYRCGTGMCFAGWTPILAEDGTSYLTEGATACHSDKVVLPSGWDTDVAGFFDRFDLAKSLNRYIALLDQRQARGATETLAKELGPDPDPDRVVVHVADYAQWKLGLTSEQADTLFAGSNTLDDIKEIWSAIKDDQPLPDKYYGEEY